MIAIFVESKIKQDSAWQDGHTFGGHFENLASALNYLKFLEDKGLKFYAQLGWDGWKR